MIHVRQHGATIAKKRSCFFNQDPDSPEKLGEELDVYDLFNLSHECVIGHCLGRVNRFLILSRFHRSLYVFAVLAIVSHTAIQFLARFELYTPVLTPTQSLVIVVVLTGVSVLSFKERWYFEHRVVNAMMDAFYAERCGDDE